MTAVSTGCTPVVGTLDRSRDLVAPALRAAVDRMDPVSRRMGSYHLGWTDAEGRPQPGNGGKAVRSALAVLSAELVGAPATVAVPGAVAVELVHNFSLVHDDLMDGDAERRHRPTVWALWGIPAAVLVGDAMMTVAQAVLLDVPGEPARAAGRLLAEATGELIRGQVDDLGFESRDGVGVAECLSMAAGKTGALLGAAAAIGAVLADADTETVARLQDYGTGLGLAFQLVDDLLGIWGDPAVTGKPVLSDLRSRKKSLPVTWAVSAGTGASGELAAWLAEPIEHDENQLARAASLVEAAGGREWAVAEADRQLAAAEAALTGLELSEPVRDELVALGRHLAARQA